MDKLRTAVIGAGYLGRFHAQKYSTESGSNLVGVVDPRAEARDALARELATTAYADHRELLGRVDAVSIVTTTPAHFAIARDFLESGAHVLVEKPITETVEQARELIAIAARATWNMARVLSKMVKAPAVGMSSKPMMRSNSFSATQMPDGPLTCTAWVSFAPQSSSTWRMLTPKGYS